MGLFHRATAKFAPKQNSPTAATQPPSSASIQPPIQTSTSASKPTSQPRSIDELEHQMTIEAQAQVSSTRPQGSPRFLPVKRTVNRLVWTTVLVGIPVGLIALINLPYAPVRRPIAQKAPFLLMPSYIQMDYNFRQAVANVEQAKQLIDAATAPTDLDLGAQKLQQAQKNLAQLPTWVWSELPDTHSWGWYNWRMTPLGLNQARAEVGRLQGKVFQEQNAQVALTQAEQRLNEAKQQYQEAGTARDQKAAILLWQDANDQLQQVPSTTLAGKTAQQKWLASDRDLAAIGGAVAGSQQSITLIDAARQFSWQAAQAGQNSPHSVEAWQGVIHLRQLAIEKLQQVSKTDPIGYGEAQKLIAKYEAEQNQIRIRLETERQAVADFNQAQAQIQRLIATTPSTGTIDRAAVSQLQQIIYQLEAIDNGTTVYLEAQKQLWTAKQKLKEWQP